MRAVLQRASEASVSIDGEVVGALDAPGLVVLLGVTHGDGPAEVATMARKIAGLRMMPGEVSVADLQAQDAAPTAGQAAGGATPTRLLVVSQFTLYGDTRKGRRPSWGDAAPGDVAEPLVDAVVEALRADGLVVATGRFGADMKVSLVNDGPFTLVVDV